MGIPFLSHSTARSSSVLCPLALVPLWLTSRALETDWLAPWPMLENVDMPSFFAIVGKTTSSQSASFGWVKLGSGGTQCAARPGRGLVDGGVETDVAWLLLVDEGSTAETEEVRAFARGLGILPPFLRLFDAAASDPRRLRVFNDPPSNVVGPTEDDRVMPPEAL